MKKWIVIMCMLALLAGGCEFTTSLTPEQAKEYVRTEVPKLQVQVDNYQKIQQGILAMITDANSPLDPNTIIKLKAANIELQTKIDNAQKILADVTVAIANVQPSGNTFADWIAIARVINAGSAPLNPYAPVVEGILGILVLVGGIGTYLKDQKAKKNDAKYQAHKQGTELTMKEVSASTTPEVKAVETLLYKNIGEARANLGVK